MFARIVKALFVASCCAALLAPAARAADFPQRPVQIIVGTGAGGGTDALARILGQKLSEKWGQPVVVVNKPGADFRIAAGYVAGSKPDGYTVFMLVIDLALPNPKGVTVTYDIVKDFAPVAEIATAPTCLAVNNSFAANSLKDILALAKAHPDKVNFSVNQNDGPAELGWRRLLAATKTPMVFLHYQGSAPALTAVLNNEAQVTLDPCVNVMPHLANGEVRVLAISQKSDLPLLASVPTFEDASGIKGYDGQGSNWYGVAVPAATPEAVVSKMRADIHDVMGDPDLQKRLTNQFVFPVLDSSGENFGRLIRNEVARWDAWSKETEALAK